MVCKRIVIDPTGRTVSEGEYKKILKRLAKNA